MAPDESRVQIAVWSPGLNLSPASLGWSVVWLEPGHPGHLDLHRISKCVIWKGTRCDNFVLVWLQSWPGSSQDPPPLFQIMLYIWQWPPTLFTCTCSLWIRRICRPVCTVSLSPKSAILERTKEQTFYTVKCWSSIVKEQINWETLINEFDETLFAAKCFIWDTKTMPKRFTHGRTSLLINGERFCKDFISKLHGYTIHNTQYTQSYCDLYCGWTPARNICIS